MKILISPDSFKGSLSALEAARAMARGARRAFPHARIALLPLADGGEGSAAALAQAGGRTVRVRVSGPLGRPVRASVLMLPRRTAVIEMAQAAGLTLVPSARRRPLRASTFGVGEMMREAVRRGARRLIVFTGGSATTDGGAGMAQALGARLSDSRGKAIGRGGAGLERLAHIDLSLLRRHLGRISVRGATDVRNPLLGPRGAARMYSPQKGATPRQVRLLERALSNLARVIRRDLGKDIRKVPGAGSAGGTGAGLVAFLGARLVSGADLVLKITGFDRRLARADLVLTGEGSLDGQTGQGKLVARVAARARLRRVPVLAFAGNLRIRPAGFRRLGLTAAFSIGRRGTSHGESMRRAAELLEERVAGVISRYYG